MNKAEIHIDKSGDLELRWYPEEVTIKGYFSWRIPVFEATALADWWRKEGAHIKTSSLPMTDVSSECLQISMSTCERVAILPRDKQGRRKIIGYELPRLMITKLVEFIEDKKGGNCSQKS
jgi:hypothetical protein